MSGITTYTFNGIAFTRIVNSEVDPPWFFDGLELTRDTVLDASSGASSYIDIGARATTALEFRATFTTAGARSSFTALLGTTHTLANTRGHSGSALLTKAKPVNSGMSSVWYCDVAFELR